MRLRQGRHVKRNVYVQLLSVPSDHDEPLFVARDETQAEAIVCRLNARTGFSEPPVAVTDARGFLHWTPISTDYGHTLRVYESSRAYRPCVWLSVADDECDATERAVHMTYEQAETLQGQLGAWLGRHCESTTGEGEPGGMEDDRQGEDRLGSEVPQGVRPGDGEGGRRAPREGVGDGGTGGAAGADDAERMDRRDPGPRDGDGERLPGLPGVEHIHVVRTPTDDGGWIDMHSARDGQVWMTVVPGEERLTHVRASPDAVRRALDALEELERLEGAQGGGVLGWLGRAVLAADRYARGPDRETER